MAPPPKMRRLRRRRRRRHRSPPQLMDDIVDEILLRLPPDDPACLARASTVSRTWRRILTDAGFSGRYRALHGQTPPLLGVLRNPRFTFPADFVPTTTSFRPSIGYELEAHMLVADCRHGRVLLHDASSMGLVVWDPITGDQHRLPLTFLMLDSTCWNAAVLCAVGSSCDHSGCRGGPFRVAVVGTLKDGVPCARLYSSKTGTWGEPTNIDQTDRTVDDIDPTLPVALVGDALYFFFEFGDGFLRYDMAGHALTVIARPLPYGRGTALMPAENGDGGLGFAGVDRDNRLRLGLRKEGPRGDAGWAAPHRIIDLKEVLPLGVGGYIPMLMSVADDGTYAIFANTDDDVFIIDLETLKARKVCKRERSSRIFPYMTFYTPGPACARDGQTSPPVEHGD